jgi:hypothetical protein
MIFLSSGDLALTMVLYVILGEDSARTTCPVKLLSRSIASLVRARRYHVIAFKLELSVLTRHRNPLQTEETVQIVRLLHAPQRVLIHSIV